MKIETEQDMQYVLQNIADRIIMLEEKVQKIEEMRACEAQAGQLRAAHENMRVYYGD